MISFPGIEEVAARGPIHANQSKSSPAISEWRSICPLEDAEEIFFHCGQLMRLSGIVPRAVQPIWWPAVIYRVALIFWFNSMLKTAFPDPSQALQSTHEPSQADYRGSERPTSKSDATHLQFAIDALPPDDPTLVHYAKFREGEPMFTRPGGGLVSLQSPAGILKHCVRVLSLGTPTRLREGIISKLKTLTERWTS